MHNYRIRDMRGLGPRHIKALEQIGIKTVRDLQGCNLQVVEAATQIPYLTLEKWWRAAHLMKIKGIGPNIAALLVYGDVAEIPHLLNLGPGMLVALIRQFNDQKHYLRIKMTLSRATHILENARSLYGGK